MPLRALVFSAWAGAALALGAVTTPAAAIPPPTGPGGPGAASYLDVARKDCVGTAHNTTSKVWFTVANGVLSGRFQSHARGHQRQDRAVHRH